MSEHEIGLTNGDNRYLASEFKQPICDLKLNGHFNQSQTNILIKSPTNSSTTQFSSICKPFGVTKPLPTELKIKTPAEMSNIFANPTLTTPPISSVWLEQGEYFFDDEFAVPVDAHLHEESTEHDGKFSLMTQSMGCDHVIQPNRDIVDQSRSDSCLYSPLDSGESALSDANVTQTTDDYSLHNSKHANDLSLNTHSHQNSNTNNTKQSMLNYEISEGNVKQPTNSNNNNPSSVSESQLSEQYSGASDSTSWMQTMMDRSCNPDLRALINRTAATIDYKLAYADSLALQQQFEEKSIDSFNSGNIIRKLSHPNRIYDLANQIKKETVNLNSVGVSADLISNSTISPDKSNHSTNSNITTWAKKHGSRESLKKKSSRPTDLTIFPTPNTKGEAPDQGSKNTWRAIKEANGALITWNQLKRTVRRAESLDKAFSVRESRRDQYDNTSDKYPPINPVTIGITSRSRSQPLSRAPHMYRFSGTLLEIFLNARGRELTSLGAHSDGSAIDMNSSFNRHHHDFVHSNSNSVSRPGFSEQLTNNHSFGKFGPRRNKLWLRGDQKYSPLQFSRLTCYVDAISRSMRSFGAQFPPLENSKEAFIRNIERRSEGVSTESPLWSTQLPSRNLSSLAHTNYYTTVRRSHPQTLYLNRPHSALHHQVAVIRNCTISSSTHRSSPSPVDAPSIAACLTASAGPDSPYLAALRAGYMARGYAVGWIGNPRASIAYPGLGLLSVPRPSRLAGSAFLSHTLPDLSFLSQAGAEEDRKGTPTMSKRRASCLSATRPERECTCTKCGCRSVSTGRASLRSNCSKTSKSVNRKQNLHTLKSTKKFDDKSSTQPVQSSNNKLFRKGENSQPDSIADDNDNECIRNSCTDGVDRSTSEPDLGSLTVDSLAQPMCSSVDSGSPWSTPSAQKHNRSQAKQLKWDSNETSFGSHTQPKKSVSFSGNIRLLHLNRTNNKHIHHHHSDSSAQPSPEPKVIPRNWGLYGEEQPVAEFNPRTSPGWETDTNHHQNNNSNGNNNTSNAAGRSDVDVRYHAMVNDVIKAVQETVAYYCQPNDLNTTTDSSIDKDSSLSNPNSEFLPYSRIEALGSSGRQPLLAVVGPLTTLLSDGLLTPSKHIFTSKPRTRLWQLVEESCRQGALPSGITYYVLNDAINQVKALTNITLEKTKFKAFICACLNAKALLMWLNALVANESLLKKFYCENAFIRQSRTAQRGLHADLITHLEQLLKFPFNLDLTIETTFKPSIDSINNTKSGTTNKHLSTVSNICSSNKRSTNQSISSPSKTTSRSNIPPATFITRRQLVNPVNTTSTTTFNSNTNTNNNANTNPNRVLSAPNHPSSSIPTTSGIPTHPSNIHHYPQHHLPCQRSLQSKISSSSTSSIPCPIKQFDPIHDIIPNLMENESSSSSLSTDLVNQNTNNSTSAQVRGCLKTTLSNLRRATATTTNTNTTNINTPAITTAIAPSSSNGNNNSSSSGISSNSSGPNNNIISSNNKSTRASNKMSSITNTATIQPNTKVMRSENSKSNSSHLEKSKSNLKSKLPTSINHGGRH